MVKCKMLSVLVVFILLLSGCADENAKPIVTFDSAGKGAYPRLISESDRPININDITGSQYVYTVEFVDADRGANVAEYILEMTYESKNGGANVGPIEFKRWSASEFSSNEEGYQQAPTITITANDALAAAGILAADLKSGDNFIFEGKVVLNDGSTFTQGNSSSTVFGAAFRGHFNFTLSAFCPSDLGGTFAYTSTAIWCSEWDGTPITGEVTIEDQGDGVYKFSDWAFGAHPVCYEKGGEVGGDLTFTETCGEVSFTGFRDEFGEIWTFDSSIDSDEWTINWSNAFGESATAVVTFPGGVPFTLK